MNENLNSLLFFYANITKSIKEAWNPFIRMYLRKFKKGLRDEIIECIDEYTLGFEEFFKVLKYVEKKTDGKICFQTCKCSYFDYDFFEREDCCNSLRIIKKRANGDTSDIFYIFSDKIIVKALPFVNTYNAVPHEFITYTNIPEILNMLKISYPSEYNYICVALVSYLVKKKGQ